MEYEKFRAKFDDIFKNQDDCMGNDTVSTYTRYKTDLEHILDGYTSSCISGLKNDTNVPDKPGEPDRPDEPEEPEFEPSFQKGSFKLETLGIKIDLHPKLRMGYGDPHGQPIHYHEEHSIHEYIKGIPDDTIVGQCVYMPDSNGELAFISITAFDEKIENHFDKNLHAHKLFTRGHEEAHACYRSGNLTSLYRLLQKYVQIPPSILKDAETYDKQFRKELNSTKHKQPPFVGLYRGLSFPDDILEEFKEDVADIGGYVALIRNNVPKKVIIEILKERNLKKPSKNSIKHLMKLAKSS